MLFLSSDCTCTETERPYCFAPLPPSSAAAGAVCAERLHPVGAGSGGLGLQTLLFAAAGSRRELVVQPAGAHRCLAVHLQTSVGVLEIGLGL